MALIALRNIRCIDYLAYGTIFTRGDVSSEKKGDVYFPARKAADERWGVVHWFGQIFLGRILGRNSLQTDRRTPDDSLIISLFDCIAFEAMFEFCIRFLGISNF